MAPIADRIEPEPEHGDDAFDEIVASGVDVHIERMSDGSYWMAIYPAGRTDRRQVVTFSTRRGALIVGRTHKD